MKRHLAIVLLVGFLAAMGCGKRQPAKPEDGPDNNQDKGSSASKDPVAEDLEKLKGTWYVIGHDYGERSIDHHKGEQYVFEGNQLSIRHKSGNVKEAAAFKLDPTAKKSHMDLTYHKGPKMGKMEAAIYILEDGTLKICSAPPEMARPSDFKTTPESHDTLVHLQRKKAEDPPTDPAGAELGRLRGPWVVIEVEEKGRRVEEGIGRELVLFDNGFELKEPDGKRIALGTCKIEMMPQVKAIDLSYKDGPHVNQTSKSIYKLENNTLRICLAPPGVDRPKEFVTKAGSDVAILVLKKLTTIQDEMEMSKLGGDWRVESAEEKGKPVEEWKGRLFIFQGDKLNIRDAKGVVLSFGTCKPLRDGEPLKMDLHYGGGSHAGLMGKLIYALEGDTLKICLAPPGSEWPSEFATPPGSDAMLILLTRKK